MGEQRGLLLFDQGRDVHVGVGQKTLRLAAAVDFKEVEARFSQGHPGADRQKAGHLMVHVRVNGPVREHHVGVFGGQEFRHRVHVRLVQLGGAIDLAKENRLRAHDFASGFALVGANLCGFVQGFARDAALAAGEINDRHGVAELRVTRQGSGAPGFRIIRVAAHTNDLELARIAGLRLGCRER